ncbi:MAG: restriction endonuclease [bacterium]|nr:restriction endonuclease [candidate division WOR-3 bacterium]
MISDSKVIKLLEQLTNGEIEELKPVFNPKSAKCVDYPLADKILTQSNSYTLHLLEDLTRLGYLTKKFYDKIMYCPVCNSTDIRYSTYCPNCGSGHILHSIVIEHPSCGYLGIEKEFTNENGHKCPKCHKELNLIGSDYNSPGYYYKCYDCGELVITPVEKWHCRQCATVFGKEEIRELCLYSYRISEEKKDKLHLERIPKNRVAELLIRDGYEVQGSFKITGRSGAEHEIDLLATKHSGPFEHRIVVGFASAEHEVDSEEVIKLYAKAYDVNAQDIIMIALPRLSPDANHFAQHYRIRVFEAEDLDKIETAFNHIHT